MFENFVRIFKFFVFICFSAVLSQFIFQLPNTDNLNIILLLTFYLAILDLLFSKTEANIEEKCYYFQSFMLSIEKCGYILYIDVFKIKVFAKLGNLKFIFGKAVKNKI